MKPTPAGWPRFSSALAYEKAAEAIDWLCDAFGFKVRIKVEDEHGRIQHCELEYGDGLIMVSQENPHAERDYMRRFLSPRSLNGANTQSIMFYVDDAAAHCAHARSRGARIIDEPTLHDYGPDHWADRSYSTFDIEGHVWWIAERVRNPPVT